MKSANFYFTAIGLFLIFLLTLPGPGQSQDNDLAPAFTRKQLAQMLAPIALYPDALLSQVLMASTYPLEVIEADRWVRKNSLLMSDSLDAALQNKDWEPSVKSLCHFPKVLALMSEKITETTNLGNAFLAQEDEVMDTIQELRVAAHEQGNLSTSPEQKVIVEKETIIIEAANPEIIYVPYYNPLYVYGSWWYPEFPPYYWGSDLLIIGAGISFWPSPFIGFAIGSWSYFDWHRHSIIIDLHKRPRFYKSGEWSARPGLWRHAPNHRKGVAYRDKPTARKFGKSPGSSREFRPDIRGFPERSSMDRQVRGPSARNVARDIFQQGGDVITVPGGRERERVEQRQQVRERVSPPSSIGSVILDPGAGVVTGQDGRERERGEQRQQVREREESDDVVRKDRTDGRTPNNAFGQVSDGKTEESNSRRGRLSRERQQSDNRDRSREGDLDKKEGRFDRGRMRR